jgi:hypothetical protein
MLLGAGFLEPMLGLPGALLRSLGAALIAYAGLLAYFGSKESLSRLVVWAVIVGNAVWAIDSAILLASGWVHPTSAGTVFVITQAVAVAMYAELQLMGLRRSTPLAA